jgi:hypothetical protein
LHFNKNLIPQSYYNETVNLDNLLIHIENINLKAKNKISIEDYVARVKKSIKKLT